MCIKMEKKKILLVGPFPPTVGGITTYILTLLKSKLKHKFEYIKFTTSRPTVGIFKDVYDYSIIFHIGFNKLFRSAMTTLYHLIKFPIILIIKNPELIHLNTSAYWSFWENSIYVLLSRFFLKKIILHIHASSFHPFYKTGNSFQKILLRKTLIMADKVVILSPRQKRFFIKLVPEDKLLIIPNVVNLDMFHDRIKSRPNESEVKVLFIGGDASKRKGIYDLIEAIPIVLKKYGSNVLFIFLGIGNSGNLKTICRKKNINKFVKFLGYVDEQIKIDFIISSDIFVLPSYAEGLPIAMLEAMAAGLPVISTPVGSIPDVIEDNINGFLIQPGNYLKLAEKIVILSTDKKLRIKMGNKNKQKIIKEYDIEILTNKLEKIYNNIK